MSKQEEAAEERIDEAEEKRRKFKTHGRKKGKVSPQRIERIEQALAEITLPHCTDHAALYDAFGRKEQTGRLVLEVGFGNGEVLATLAQRHPEACFIGIDVFLEGFGTLIHRLDQVGADNVRLVRENAFQVLLERIPPQSLDWVIVNFPDPWRKKRHFKRRIVQTAFLDALAPAMKPGGDLTLATDWENYAEWMVEHIEPHPAFDNQASPGPFGPQPDWWIETNFQRKGVAKERIIYHLHYQRNARSL
uniref:tRNA (guanine-N(7)-)-methyltransferase n=1 Tax=Magnetococcus massalia (strain MO-1) TaxID=451514 RepID=A0A1S7LLQ0_MAGMO|nr:tRNA (guanine-N(7)-)-methyltransferase [Candidatus Magnetococcus massalia]